MRRSGAGGEDDPCGEQGRPGEGSELTKERPGNSDRGRLGIRSQPTQCAYIGLAKGRRPLGPPHRGTAPLRRFRPRRRFGCRPAARRQDHERRAVHGVRQRTASARRSGTGRRKRRTIPATSSRRRWPTSCRTWSRRPMPALVCLRCSYVSPFSGRWRRAGREPFGPDRLLSRSRSGGSTRRAGAERRTAQPLTRLACGGHSGLFPGPGLFATAAEPVARFAGGGRLAGCQARGRALRGILEPGPAVLFRLVHGTTRSGDVTRLVEGVNGNRKPRICGNLTLPLGLGRPGRGRARRQLHLGNAAGEIGSGRSPQNLPFRKDPKAPQRRSTTPRR